MKRYNPTAKNNDHAATAVAPPGAAKAEFVPPVAASSGPLKKLSFGGIAKKKEDSKTAYPVVPDPNGQLGEIAARIIERTEQLDAITGALETDKKELRCLTTPFYFQNAHGKADVASSVSVPSPSGEVLVTFQNRYKAIPDENAVLPVLGDKTGLYFKQAFTLTIDGDKLPVDQAGELLNELQGLFARFNATDALSVKETVKPVPDFHARRHLELTLEQNLALDEACPIVAAIKTRGRK